MSNFLAPLLGWFGAGLVWGPATYSGLLARSQRRYPFNAAANFKVDVTCSLMIGLLVFTCFPLGFVAVWLTRGFDQGHQWWGGK